VPLYFDDDFANGKHIRDMMDPAIQSNPSSQAGAARSQWMFVGVPHSFGGKAEVCTKPRREPTVVAAVELGKIRSSLVVPMLKEEELIGVYRISAGSPSVHRETNRFGYELRGPGGHCHLERATAERIAPAHH
jgi:hypothetical protein